jgi:integrase
LSPATIYSILAALKASFQWLSGQKGYRSRLTPSDAEYFNATSRDTTIAKAQRSKPVPTLEQIRHVVNFMPCQSELERRNGALIACAILIGARDNALASLRLGDVNLDDAGRWLNGASVIPRCYLYGSAYVYGAHCSERGPPFQ